MICVCHRQDIGFLPLFFFFFFFDSLILVTREELEGKGSDVPLTKMAEDEVKPSANTALIVLSMCRVMKLSCQECGTCCLLYFTQ